MIGVPNKVSGVVISMLLAGMVLGCETPRERELSIKVNELEEETRALNNQKKIETLEAQLEIERLKNEVRNRENELKKKTEMELEILKKERIKAQEKARKAEDKLKRKNAIQKIIIELEDMLANVRRFDIELLKSSQQQLTGLKKDEIQNTLSAIRPISDRIAELRRNIQLNDINLALLQGETRVLRDTFLALENTWKNSEVGKMASSPKVKDKTSPPTKKPKDKKPEIKYPAADWPGLKEIKLSSVPKKLILGYENKKREIWEFLEEVNY